MKKAATLFALAAICVALAAPAMAAEAKSYTNVALVDVNCSTKVKDDPDAHKKDCAIRCASNGYGIWTEGKYLKFDAAGNEKALAALKASAKTDKLRVNVSGQLEGEQLKVESLSMVE